MDNVLFGLNRKQRIRVSIDSEYFFILNLSFNGMSKKLSETIGSASEDRLLLINSTFTFKVNQISYMIETRYH